MLIWCHLRGCLYKKQLEELIKGKNELYSGKASWLGWKASGVSSQFKNC